MEWQTLSASESETLERAAELGRVLKPGDAVSLTGPLGAGKTLFCRGLARALGYAGPVTSPSYALVHEYAGAIPIYHLDLYRLALGADWEEIGIDHYFGGSGICLVEWPERLPAGRAVFTWRIDLTSVDATRRHLRLSAAGRFTDPVFSGWSRAQTGPPAPATPETYRP